MEKKIDTMRAKNCKNMEKQPGRGGGLISPSIPPFLIHHDEVLKRVAAAAATTTTAAATTTTTTTTINILTLTGSPAHSEGVLFWGLSGCVGATSKNLPVLRPTLGFRV